MKDYLLSYIVKKENREKKKKKNPNKGKKRNRCS